MKVYVLVGYFFGEGNENVGIFSSKENAEKVKDSKPKSSQEGDYEFFDIEEFEIDKP